MHLSFQGKCISPLKYFSEGTFTEKNDLLLDMHQNWIIHSKVTVHWDQNKNKIKIPHVVGLYLRSKVRKTYIIFNFQFVSRLMRFASLDFLNRWFKSNN